MVYKSSYVFWAKIFSTLIAPYFKGLNFFRKNYDLRLIKVKTILVTEYHRIGDVIIIAPILKSIKSKYPDAEIILLCNESAKALAEELKLADRVFGVSVPWTNWNWSVFDWYKIRNFAKRLHLIDIDLAIDFKGDLRNSWFLWNTHPKVSFGYNTTGGKYFFTNPYEMNQKDHQFLRASKLIQQLGCQLIKDKDTRYFSVKNGSIVLHTGASNLERSWPNSYWEELVRLLIEDFKVSLVVTKESSSLFQSLKTEGLELEFFEGGLVTFCNYIKSQKCLIALDSMAGHLASYVGIPVISLFGSQNPELTKPINKYGKIIKPRIPCKHKRSHWRLCKLCLKSISPKKVYSEVSEHILHIENNL
tara:strand:+ start:39 stop:1121 length:1083 start_codon:yes stop_codon:yes gene_type:complete